MMKVLIKLLILSLYSTIFIQCEGEVGVRVGIHQEFINYSAKHFMTYFLSVPNAISLGDIDVQTSALGLHLNNILLHLIDCDTDNVELTLISPNKLHFVAKRLSGSFDTTISVQLGHLPSITDNNAMIHFHNVDVEGEVELKAVDSNIPGKQMPHVNITALHFPSYDLNIVSKLLEPIIDKIKEEASTIISKI
jgi:hypothetical protein